MEGNLLERKGVRGLSVRKTGCVGAARFQVSNEGDRERGTVMQGHHP